MSFSLSSDSNGRSFDSKRKYLSSDKKKNLLMKDNYELSNQMITLRKQFDDALSISSKIDNLYSINSENTKEISRLRSENEDLKRRLQISLQANNDLQSKIQNMQNFHNSIHNNSKQDSELFIKQRNQYESIISEYKKRIEECEQQRDKIRNENEQNKLMLESVLNACGRYFNKMIDSSSAAIDCFMNAKSSLDNDLVLKNIQKLEDRISKLLRKIKKKEKIIETLKKSYFDLTLNEKHKESQTEIKIMDLASQVTELKEKNQKLTVEIDELTRKNSSLIEELSHKNSQIKHNMIQSENQLENENQQLKAKYSNSQTQLNSLIKENKSMKHKLFIIVQKAKSLDKKNKDMINTINTLEEKKESLKSEVQQYVKIHTEAEFQLKDVENSLIRAQDELNLQKKENDKLQDEILQNNEKIKQDEKKILELKNEKDQLNIEFQQANAQFKASKQQILYCEEQIEKLKKENEVLEKQLKDAENPLESDNLVPPSILSSPDFPSELQTILGEISRNTCLNLHVRIQSIFSTIAKYFRNLLDLKEKGNEDVAKKLSSLKTQVDSLLDFLKRLMPEVRINFELLLSDEQTRNILGDAIRNLKDNQRIQPMIDTINAELGISKIEDAKRAIDDFRILITKLNKRNKKIQDSKRKLKRNFRKIEAEYQSDISSLQKCFQDLEAKNKTNQEEKNSIQNQIFEIQRENKQTTDELTATYENKILNLNQTIEALQDKMKNYSLLEESISKLSKRKDHLESELKLRINQIEDSEKNYKARIKSEKEKYEQAIEQNRKQALEMQLQIRDLSENIAKLEATNKVLSNNNNEMSLRIQKLETRNTAVQAEFDRNKKALESQFDAKLHFQETEYKSRIEEKQAQIELIKKRLIESISRYFSSYLDGLHVDESNLEGALQVIKRKFDTLLSRENNIRSRFQLDSRQPLEDAISEMLTTKRR